uniref:HTH_Tnp_Tc3_2 domain-containing protein n=1 Tax=Parastrongyloides trichosuri TaxID=131310 RepID=A0A0N4Z6H7_PARTI
MKTSNGNIMNLPVIMGERKYLNNENIDDDANCGSHNNPNKNIVYVNNFYRRINTNDNAYARKPYDKLSSKSQRRRNVLFTKILLKRNGGQKLHIATLRHIIKEMGHEQSFMPTLSLGELQEYALHHKVSMRSVYKIKQIIEDKLQYKMFPSVSEIKTIWQTSGVVIDESQMEEVYKSVLENCDNYQYEVSEMKTHIDYSQFNDPV